MSAPNRKYKDSVFVDLFSEDEKAKENFLSLYNALHGTNLLLSCPVETIRLDNVMYMSIINDISCLVDNKIIVLAEHQSTINENMPSANTVHPCTVFACEFLLTQKHRCCVELPPSMAVLIRRGLFAAAAWMLLVSTRSDVLR